jgi:hypothetical protein
MEVRTLKRLQGFDGRPRPLVNIARVRCDVFEGECSNYLPQGRVVGLEPE